MTGTRARSGLTIIELLTVIAIIAVLATLILPAVFGGRESARKIVCVSNLHQLSLAINGYEAANRAYVPMRGGPLTNSDNLWIGGRVSGYVALCPLLDRKDIYNAFSYGFEATAPRIKFARDGEPWWRGGNYTPWRTELAVLRCPSDPGRMKPADWNSMGRCNYAFCMGDSQMGIEFSYWETPIKAVRGMFQQRYGMIATDCSDGLSNTIALGEIASAYSHGNNERTTGSTILGYQATQVPQRMIGRGIIPAVCQSTANAGRYNKEQTVVAKRGMHWGDGNPDLVGFNTILAPNSASCVSTVAEGPGVFSAASYHVGGAHVLMLDGNIRFISDSIDTGDLKAESPGVFYENGNEVSSINWQSKSPYGTWGAMGSRNAGD